MPVFVDGQKIATAQWARLIESIPASYTVWYNNSDSKYYAECLLKGGTDYGPGTLSTVLQAANDALASGGTIALKEIRKPNDVTLSSDVNLLEFYQGNMREYTSTGLKFRCLGTREEKGLPFYDSTDGSYVVRVLSGAPDSTYVSWWTIGETFGFGTYQWTGYDANIAANREIIFGFENHHGNSDEGIISFAHVSSSFTAANKWNSNTQSTGLSGMDWTSETTFKVEWSASAVKFYVDGNLEATHTTANAIPQEPMCFFSEALTAGAQAGATFGVWLRNFEEIV